MKARPILTTAMLVAAAIAAQPAAAVSVTYFNSSAAFNSATSARATDSFNVADLTPTLDKFFGVTRIVGPYSYSLRGLPGGAATTIGSTVYLSGGTGGSLQFALRATSACRCSKGLDADGCRGIPCARKQHFLVLWLQYFSRIGQLHCRQCRCAWFSRLHIRRRSDGAANQRLCSRRNHAGRVGVVSHLCRSGRLCRRNSRACNMGSVDRGLRCNRHCCKAPARSRLSDLNSEPDEKQNGSGA